MGDDSGSGLVTGCCLRSLGNHRQQTEMHYLGWAKKQKQTEPEPSLDKVESKKNCVLKNRRQENWFWDFLIKIMKLCNIFKDIHSYL